MKKRLMFAIITTITLLSATSVAAGPAMAAPTAAASHSASAPVPASVTASGVTPASCALEGFVVENGNVVYFYCLGYFYEPSGGWTISEVYPYTNNRWWLHGSSGWTYCVWGQSPHNIPSQYQHPANIQIVSNTASC